jgi:hypothetical protein
MKKMSFALVGAAASRSPLAAVQGDDSLGENVQENYEAAADNLEAAADNTTGAEAATLENQADALEAEGARKEEAIDDADVNAANSAPLRPLPSTRCNQSPARTTDGPGRSPQREAGLFFCTGRPYLRCMTDSEAIPAATLVVMREQEQGPPELLMVERPRTMAFAGGAMVFPGGRIDPADWQGPSRSRKRRPRRRARNGRGDRARGAARTLVPFARWRPDNVRHRRFDTFFFIAPCPADAGPLRPQPGECERALWISAPPCWTRDRRGSGQRHLPDHPQSRTAGAVRKLRRGARPCPGHPVEIISPWIEERGGHALSRHPRPPRLSGYGRKAGSRAAGLIALGHALGRRCAAPSGSSCLHPARGAADRRRGLLQRHRAGPALDRARPHRPAGRFTAAKIAELGETMRRAAGPPRRAGTTAARPRSRRPAKAAATATERCSRSPSRPRPPGWSPAARSRRR